MINPTVYYDARSLDKGRTSGWERFSRELFASLSESPSSEFFLKKFNQGDSSTLTSVLRDMSSIQFQGSIRHYPTIPPVYANSQTVLTIHDATWWKYPQHSSKLGRHLLKALAERAVKKGAKVVTVSHAAKADLQCVFGLDPEQIDVVYPGLTKLPSSMNSAHPNKNRPYLLFVGTLEPRKGLDTLLKAYALSKLNSEIDLVVVGRIGWGSSVPKGVKYVGAATDTQLAVWLAHAQTLVVPSIYEGFGLPVIEAFSLGCPVIASDIPVFHEASGGLATFFEAREPDSLSTAITNTLGAEVDRVGLSTWASKFNWANSGAEYAKIYKKVNDGTT